MKLHSLPSFFDFPSIHCRLLLPRLLLPRLLLLLLSGTLKFSRSGAQRSQDTNSIQQPLPIFFTETGNVYDNYPNALPGSSGGQPSPCQESSCYPATGDLLMGRENQLHASSTCGLRGPQRYCVISHLDDSKKCFTCDSREPHRLGLNEDSHRIENVVSSFSNRRPTWWQAENGKEFASIQLDLEAEFHFTHLIMTFKTFRPATMIIERSPDFGKTWKTYRYFAWDCEHSFPGVKLAPQTAITDIVCEGRYSDVAPSTRGEIIFRVLSPNLEIEDPYAQEVQDLLKMTNLRLNFTSLHNLGDNLLDPRDEIQEKYYYAIYDMVVRGSCSCYGHASRCIPLDNQQVLRQDKVFGKCECQHNTTGLNCERCEDFYNDLPWMPAIGTTTNACKRCNCNDHATRCHFDPSVFAKSVNTSGGICDDCAHNTMGTNCELCRPGYYQDPGRSIRDPAICQACDCDRVGSQNNGECESKTDPVNDLVAGRCICKRNVGGNRCDRCKAGFWNRKIDNTEGCDACRCDTFGTVDNRGCDEITGECTCKRYVEGRNCDRCRPEFYGLSNDQDGCKACDCYPGGAFDNQCDTVNGQCRCKPHMTGRRCDTPVSGRYCVLMDHYRYEAEYSRGERQAKVIARSPSVERPTTWTGEGFMEVHEGDKIVFEVNNIVKSLEYQLVIRYEPQLTKAWDDVRITLTRPQPVNQNGPCSNTIPQDDLKLAYLPPGNRYYIVSSPICLERGVRYTITLDFTRFQSGQVTPDAMLLVDAIVLIPTTDSIGVFQGRGRPEEMKNEYNRYRCRENAFGVVKPQLSEACKKYVCAVADTITPVPSCDCDPTGSLSTVCYYLGGDCECKAKVVGRKCDKCAPGFWGFGPTGCQPCNCESSGSRSNFCDSITGQCPCTALAYGRRCSECQPGYYGFPDCQPCKCNGHAVTCNSLTGVCLSCSDSTSGANCDRCADGYYGDPRLGSASIPCRPCMCPGGLNSTQQFADTCALIPDPAQPRTQEVRCNCKVGYTGARCDKCADNYFGNPRAPGGSCKPCVCNDNINLNNPGSCDQETGECKKCLYNSEGFNCETCKKGFYGDSTKQDCRPCSCNLLGTDQSEIGECDRVSGQCSCLPNVKGRQCDACEVNHWKIASGKGCEECDCDPMGSIKMQCNEFTGKCKCKPKRGGRRCSECEDYHWGDPTKDQCEPCQCDPSGSLELQCHRQTGKCNCEKGVTGAKCDRCDRGTTGTLPNCVPCGECFDNWDKIVQGLINETNYLVGLAKDMRQNGSVGSYAKSLGDLESKIEDIKSKLLDSQLTDEDVSAVKEKIKKLKGEFEEEEQKIKDLKAEMKKLEKQTKKAQEKVESAEMTTKSRTMDANDLVDQLNSVKDRDLDSIFAKIEEKKKKSDEAADQVKDAEQNVDRSKQLREQTEKKLEDHKAALEDQMKENGARMAVAASLAESAATSLDAISGRVCGGGGVGGGCDAECGGIGCDASVAECGGKKGSKCDGSMRYAKDAASLTEAVEADLDSKLPVAKSTHEKAVAAAANATAANEAAVAALNASAEAKSQAEGASKEITGLLEKIGNILDGDVTTRADIETLVNLTLALSIGQDPQAIDDLAKQINETIKSLSNIETILEQTKDNLTNADQLKTMGKMAKERADEVYGKAKKVVEQIRAADETNKETNQNLDVADKKAKTSTDLLTDIGTNSKAAKKSSDEAGNKLADMEKRVDELQKKLLSHSKRADDLDSQSSNLTATADAASEKAKAVGKKYDEAAAKLSAKAGGGAGGDTALDAKKLKIRAERLFQDTRFKFERLEELEQSFEDNDKTLTRLQEKIENLNNRMIEALYTKREGSKDGIHPLSNHHRTCLP